jgi:DNA-binding transcriptional LysR family regulator
MSDIDVKNIRRLDGGLLLVFRELMRQRSATAAAKQLRFSQSAISHSLTRLRDIFGDPLFMRRAHGLEPTRRALSLATRIDELIDLTSAAIHGKDTFDPADTQRQFRLAAAEFVTILISSKLADIFQQSAPNASFGIGFHAQEAALDALRSGEIDLALGRYRKLSAELLVEPLFEDRYCVVARLDHPRLKGRITRSLYSEMKHVLAWAPSEVATDSMPDIRGGYSAVAVVPHWLTALTLVARSDLIATVPRRLAKRQADLLGLQIMAVPFPHPPFVVSLVRRARHEDLGVTWLLDQVRRSI